MACSYCSRKPPLSQNAKARSRLVSGRYSVIQAPQVCSASLRFRAKARKNSEPVSDAVPSTRNRSILSCRIRGLIALSGMICVSGIYAFNSAKHNRLERPVSGSTAGLITSPGGRWFKATNADGPLGDRTLPPTRRSAILHFKKNLRAHKRANEVPCTSHITAGSL